MDQNNQSSDEHQDNSPDQNEHDVDDDHQILLTKDLSQMKLSNNDNDDDSIDDMNKIQSINKIKALIESNLAHDAADNGSNRRRISYISYENETQMPDIMRLIQKDLSEPYSIYTYRYFIHNWPQLCFLAMDSHQCVGAIVCKLDYKKRKTLRGYIAMLAVDERYRKRRIGSTLVLKAIQSMIELNADEIVLETEVTNGPALILYENLGFIRDKRLFRYYLNGVDALRLKLWLK